MMVYVGTFEKVSGLCDVVRAAMVYKCKIGVCGGVPPAGVETVWLLGVMQQVQVGG